MITIASEQPGVAHEGKRHVNLVVPRAWVRGGLLAAAVGMILFAAFSLDATVRGLVLRESTAEQRQVADLISRYTKDLWLFAVPVLGWIISGLYQRRDWQRRWIAVLAATALAGVAVNIPRSLTGRARPSNQEAQGWFGVRHEGQWLIGRPAYNSFPSGHTATAAGLAFATVLCFRRRGWLILVGAVAVGASRILVSAHHFSDVVAGFLLGGAMAGLAWQWFRRNGWLEVEPMAAAPAPVIVLPVNSLAHYFNHDRAQFVPRAAAGPLWATPRRQPRRHHDTAISSAR